jgi:hypothetical protein
LHSRACCRIICSCGGLRTSAEAFIDGGNFIANTADQGGGALVEGVATVNRALFNRNLALFRGGGLDVVTAPCAAQLLTGI